MFARRCIGATGSNRLFRGCQRFHVSKLKFRKQSFSTASWRSRFQNGEFKFGSSKTSLQRLFLALGVTSLSAFLFTNYTPQMKSYDCSLNCEDNSMHQDSGLNEFGWSDLHVACVRGDIVEARRILTSQSKIDVNAQDQYTGHVPGTLDEVFRLTQTRRKAFSTSGSCPGATALHYAMYSGNSDLVKLLFEYGADPRIKDYLNRSPVEYCQDEDLIGYFHDLEKEFEEVQRQREKEIRRLYPLEKRLKEAIVGQEGPINAVASAIRRRENGWHDEDRPLVFLFLGSSGIGKTELAKQVANYIHKDDKDGFIRIDMSEFQTKHEVSKFIGSPPGYVGYEEGGQLTDKLRKSKDKNVVVLLDEVEKAHPDILTVMLQLFDEGRLTDGKGVTVECKNAIFILTSNLAQTEIADEAESLRQEAKQRGQNVPIDDVSLISRRFQNTIVYPILRGHFKRDEFLGRIDEILYFLPFNEAELGQIVVKELNRWSQKAEERHQMVIEWDEKVVQKISEGYNIRYGARSIKHEVEKRVVNQIAKAHENDQLAPGDKIKIFVDQENDNNIKFNILKGEGKKVTKTTSFFGNLWSNGTK